MRLGKCRCDCKSNFGCECSYGVFKGFHGQRKAGVLFDLLNLLLLLLEYFKFDNVL